MVQNGVEVLPQQQEPLAASDISPTSWKTAWKEAGWIFLLSRLALLALTFLGPSVFARLDGNHKVWRNPLICVSQTGDCLHLWDNWDVSVFVDVARAGYYKPDHSLTPFFPAWPLLEHLFGGFLPDSSTSLFYTGFVLANICFLIALVLLYQIVCTCFSSAVAHDTLLLLTINPYALFFFVGYSESLFLLLCVAMFFFLQRGRSLDWWLAGLCGMLAALTRALGIVFAVPFLVILVQRFWPYRPLLWTRWRSLLNAATPILLIPFGLALYMLYLAVTNGNPLEFSVQEAATWGRHLDFPWVGFINDVISFTVPTKHFASNVLDLVFTLLSMATLVVGWKYLYWPYRLFALTLIVCSLCNPVVGIGYPLSSMPRFMMVIFPLFIVAALWGQKYPRLRSVIIASSLILFTFHALLFLAHGWVA